MICRKKLTFVKTIMVLTDMYDLQERVLDICKNSRGVDTSIFQIPEKLHLTLGTLVIMDEHERATATQILGECKANFIV
jgi:activating signal cointegrator complex subunit 1